MSDVLHSLTWDRILLLLALAAWVGADTTAFFQIMISQPLVAAWLGGLAAGDGPAGLAVGILLQGVWARSLPMGGASIPWTGPAALVAGALACGRGEHDLTGTLLQVPDAVTLAVVMGTALLLGEVGRRVIRRLGHRRRPWVVAASEAAGRGDPAGVVRANRLGIAQTAVASVALAAGGLILGHLLLLVLDPIPPLDGRWPAMLLLGLGLGQTASLVPQRRLGWIWLATVLVAVTALRVVP